MSEHFNIAVIGTGPGGYIAALKAAQKGAKTAVIEKHHLGGTCLNYGCIPSKALLSSAELLDHMAHSSKWGINVKGTIGFDWPAIQKRKDGVILQLRGGINSLLKGRSVTLYQGTAKLDGAGTIAITSSESKVESITADKIILATGSRPTRVPSWPSDPRLVCTSDEAVHWQDLPAKLVIVGGGVIGCEFACMMRAFGVDVTLIEMLPKLLPGIDEDIADALQRTFKKRGIAIHTGTKVESMGLGGSGVRLKLSNGTEVDCDRVLVSVGRQPNTGGIGLESVGVQTNERGFVAVNDFLETKVAGTYCIGDANGRCMLAHAASAHAVAAVENALGHARAFDAPIPSAVYTFPEIGAVGLTEQEALRQHLPISVGTFPIGHLGKAMATNHTEGFVKTIRHRETGAILGVHMFGHNATECIGAAAAMMHQRASMRDLAETVFAHPTLGEAVKESAEDALGMGLHLPPRKLITWAV